MGLRAAKHRTGDCHRCARSCSWLVRRRKRRAMTEQEAHIPSDADLQPAHGLPRNPPNEGRKVPPVSERERVAIDALLGALVDDAEQWCLDWPCMNPSAIIPICLITI